jgi:hypothetical protein
MFLETVGGGGHWDSGQGHVGTGCSGTPGQLPHVTLCPGHSAIKAYQSVRSKGHRVDSRDAKQTTKRWARTETLGPTQRQKDNSTCLTSLARAHSRTITHITHHNQHHSKKELSRRDLSDMGAIEHKRKPDILRRYQRAASITPSIAPS